MENSRNIRIFIQYDGSRYRGWQRLGDNGNTLQEKIETVLGRMAGEPVHLIGSGRTDAGVHAEKQTANFHYTGPLSCSGILDYCRKYLPEDISVFYAEETGSRFHSRYNAVRKIYAYRIWNAPAADVFLRKYRWHIPKPLDIRDMTGAAGYFVGEKDFQSFTAMKSKKKSTVREIFRLTIKEELPELEIRFEGNGFLHNMIRIITGTLVEAGSGRLYPEEIPAIFARKTRADAGPAAPPHGLFLVDTLYDIDEKPTIV